MRTDSEQYLQLGKWIGGAAAGALVMYMLDPERGAARRAVSVERLRQLGRHTGAAIERVGKELGTSVDSVAASARQMAGQARASLDHALPRAGAASASNSASSGDSYAPDGTGRDSMHRMVTMPGRRARATRWGTGTRAAAMAGGGALGLVGLLRPRSPIALLAALAGMLLLARGAANRPLRSMVPVSAQARPVALEKSVRIDAAPEQVFDLFADYENFPRFLSNVIEVRDLGNRRSHWRVRGPAGGQYSWNAVLSEHSRPHRLAWHSEPGAAVDNAGSIHIDPVGRGSTRVTIRLNYRPPAGSLGRAIAGLFGKDPGQQLEEDLQCMKELAERGSITSRSSSSRRSEGKALH